MLHFCPPFLFYQSIPTIRYDKHNIIKLIKADFYLSALGEILADIILLCSFTSTQ